MTDPAKNTFQNQLSLYLGGTDGSTLGAGMTGSALQSTTSRSFVMGYQGPPSPLSIQSGTSCGIELKAEPQSNASWIDFHSTSCYFNNSYDFRLQSTGGATGVVGQASLIALGKDVDFRCPINIGLGFPQFKLDYGQSAQFPNGSNPSVTITFTQAFTNVPTVQATLRDTLVAEPPDNQGNIAGIFIESLTVSGCVIRCRGTTPFTQTPTNIVAMWTAIGV